jgi:GNAT superfamily N-acetyltransferase
MSGESEFLAVAPGKIAAVVTYLEMHACPEVPETRAPAGVGLRRVHDPEPGWFRDLFRRIGTDWLWFSRLRMDDETLARTIRDPLVHVHAVTFRGRDEGLLELDFRQDGECELSFLGLTPALVGTGTGRWLMREATSRAWDEPIRRFWVHTCTLDHPNALGFYRRSGFTACRREIEILDDPRLTGLITRGAAPDIPVIEP